MLASSSLLPHTHHHRRRHRRRRHRRRRHRRRRQAGYLQKYLIPFIF